jgi:hypothetical protein
VPVRRRIAGAARGEERLVAAAAIVALYRHDPIALSEVAVLAALFFAVSALVRARADSAPPVPPEPTPAQAAPEPGSEALFPAWTRGLGLDGRSVADLLVPIVEAANAKKRVEGLIEKDAAAWCARNPGKWHGIYTSVMTSVNASLVDAGAQPLSYRSYTISVALLKQRLLPTPV